jgi:hypothetical protein
VRHPIEIYTELLRLLTDCLHAPVATVRLSGGDPGTGTQVGMARRLVQEAARESRSRLLLTEAALDGVWS